MCHIKSWLTGESRRISPVPGKSVSFQGQFDGVPGSGKTYLGQGKVPSFSGIIGGIPGKTIFVP